MFTELSEVVTCYVISPNSCLKFRPLFSWLSVQSVFGLMVFSWVWCIPLHSVTDKQASVFVKESCFYCKRIFKRLTNTVAPVKCPIQFLQISWLQMLLKYEACQCNLLSGIRMAGPFACDSYCVGSCTFTSYTAWRIGMNGIAIRCYFTNFIILHWSIGCWLFHHY
jgi:hypothetical protein